MRTIILFLIYVLFTILLTPLLFLCYLLRCSQPLIWSGKQVMKLGPRILGIRLEVKGIEKVKRNKTYVFMSNHLSFLDGPLLFMLIPQPIRVILKKEVFRIPIIGLGMRQIRFIPVDRKGIRGGKKSIDQAVRLMNEKGYSFLIFPEGTRSQDGRMQPFRRGGFFLALDSGVPIVPVTIQGTYELMPRGSFFVRKGKVKVVFHSPVSVEGYDKDRLPILIAKVREDIQSGFDDKGTVLGAAD